MGQGLEVYNSSGYTSIGNLPFLAPVDSFLITASEFTIPYGRSSYLFLLTGTPGSRLTPRFINYGSASTFFNVTDRAGSPRIIVCALRPPAPKADENFGLETFDEQGNRVFSANAPLSIVRGELNYQITRSIDTTWANYYNPPQSFNISNFKGTPAVPFAVTPLSRSLGPQMGGNWFVFGHSMRFSFSSTLITADGYQADGGFSPTIVGYYQSQRLLIPVFDLINFDL